MGECDREEFYRVAVLDGTNFVAWKFRMLSLLEEHDLRECIEVELANVAALKEVAGDSSEVKSQKQRALEKHKKKDKKCKSMLISRIHDDQLEHLQGRETPKQMWDALTSIYERKMLSLVPEYDTVVTSIESQPEEQLTMDFVSSSSK
uniref:Retrotransposon Copia-like N-terminal domain-containing protein n=1 Tax=Anopheles epiroticus TaxID=199890 RepID=A0A182PUL7_9DIPT